MKLGVPFTYPDVSPGFAVALAGSNPTTEARSLKPGQGRPRRPSLGSAPGTSFEVAGCNEVGVGFGIVGGGEVGLGACGRANIAVVNRRMMNSTPMVNLWGMDS
jgi:hypothetical protein